MGAQTSYRVTPTWVEVGLNWIELKLGWMLGWVVTINLNTLRSIGSGWPQWSLMGLWWCRGYLRSRRHRRGDIGKGASAVGEGGGVGDAAGGSWYDGSGEEYSRSCSGVGWTIGDVG